MTTHSVIIILWLCVPVVHVCQGKPYKTKDCAQGVFILLYFFTGAATLTIQSRYITFLPPSFLPLLSFCPSSSLHPSLKFGVCTCMFACVSVLSLPPSLPLGVYYLSLSLSLSFSVSPLVRSDNVNPHWSDDVMPCPSAGCYILCTSCSGCVRTFVHGIVLRQPFFPKLHNQNPIDIVGCRYKQTLKQLER